MLPAPLLSAPNAVPLYIGTVYSRHEALKTNSEWRMKVLTLRHLYDDNIKVAGPHLQRIGKDETASLAKEVFYREHLLPKKAKKNKTLH